MLNLIETFRQNDSPHFFLRPIFDSQTCEKTFRQLRSMGTVNFTKNNFSLYELIHMIGRIEVQNDIAYFKLSEQNISFPIDHKRRQKTKLHPMPSQADVKHDLDEARQTAIADAISLGMCPENLDHFEFHTRVDAEVFENDSMNVFTDENIQNDDSIYEEEDDDDDLLANSPFTEIIDERE